MNIMTAKSKNHPRSKERGGIFMFGVTGISAIMMMTALALDTYTLATAKLQGRNIAESVALTVLQAAAERSCTDTQRITYGEKVAKLSVYSFTSGYVINDGDLQPGASGAHGNLKFGNYAPGYSGQAGTFTAEPSGLPRNAVRVTIKLPSNSVTLRFSNMFGNQTSPTLQATATAYYNSAGATTEEKYQLVE